MSEEERAHLIESLIFLTGKPAFWFKGKTDRELIALYDGLMKIY